VSPSTELREDTASRRIILRDECKYGTIVHLTSTVPGTEVLEVEARTKRLEALCIIHMFRILASSSRRTSIFFTSNTMSASRRQSYVHTASHPREETPLEVAVEETWEEAERFVAKVCQEKETLTFYPPLTDAYFCGHLMADLDSIAGAIGAAHLYQGTPARASEINSETKWALKEWGCEEPASIEDLLRENPQNNVCLVDFQQQSQLNPAIPMANIVGIIDHHALQSNTIVTEKPIFVDIRPWGCMSSILAHSYAVQEVNLPKNIAGMLLSAILSDTLNLRSPTTTKWDERMVSMLVQHLDIADVNELAATQFRAKSHDLLTMTPYQLVNGDMKAFKFADADDPATIYSIGYGVIETTDAEASLARIDELIPEMQQVREEKELSAMFLAVVDIVNMTSSLFIAGHVEESLALEAHGGEITQDGKVLELKGLVSRKKDFVPALTRAISSGWKPPAKPFSQQTRRRSSVVVMDFTDYGPGRLNRIFDEEDLSALLELDDSEDDE
jgi:manganese-dependent inorganic pyrophosphatase